MAKGELRVSGKMVLGQFWPTGLSDADTVTVQLTANSFTFSPDPANKPFRTTKAFDNATVKGTTTRPAIRKNNITIRLQGIDATELHYAATLHGTGLQDNGKRFRQFFGETATEKLHDFTAQLGTGPIPCEVVSAVDHPNDVFDTFGRFVGDVLITIKGKKVDLNHWLVENGWAFQTYYNSMSPDEIKIIQKLSEAARKAKRGIWPHLIQHVGQLNPGMVFRLKGKPNDKADIGPVLMPKIFRRQVRFVISQLNHLPAGSGDFRSFLGAQTDPFVTLKAFLKNPKVKAPGKTSPNANLKSLFNAQEVFASMPGDLVFFEKPSTLVDSSGNPITTF